MHFFSVFFLPPSCFQIPELSTYSYTLETTKCVNSLERLSASLFFVLVVLNFEFNLAVSPRAHPQMVGMLWFMFLT